MNSKQELTDELKSVADRIGTARDALTRNEIVEMSDIPDRMRTVANAITDLPPEEAIELRPALSDLLTDFKGFAEELQDKIGEIKAAGGTAAGQSGG